MTFTSSDLFLLVEGIGLVANITGWVIMRKPHLIGNPPPNELVHRSPEFWILHHLQISVKFVITFILEVTQKVKSIEHPHKTYFDPPSGGKLCKLPQGTVVKLSGNHLDFPHHCREIPHRYLPGICGC